MPVHQEIKKILDVIPKYDPSHRVVLESHREQFNTPAIPLENRAQVYEIEDRVVSAPDADIPIRIYTPIEAGAYPILLYFHGGAFFTGNIESHDEVARALCADTNHKVIAIDYRLAPEHAFPAGIEDCYYVTRWVTENADELKWDRKNLAVSGDSSGGNFAAVITHLARERKEFTVTKQVLLYPAMDVDLSEFHYASLSENGSGYFVESAQMEELYSFYVNSGANPKDPLVSPIRASNFENLPEALVITAEYDPMRDEGELYAEKLKSAGVPVELKRYEGATHGFLGKWTHLPEYADVYQFIGKFLNK